jgi:copper chaperone
MGRFNIRRTTSKGHAMITFQVNDMTCGHCASAIARAIAGVDPGARMDIRIHQKLVRVSSAAPAEELATAIQDAGYTPLRADAAAVQEPVARGCGCGCSGNAVRPPDAGQATVPLAGACCA